MVGAIYAGDTPETAVQVGGFFNWSLDTDADDEDATTYESEGWKEFARTLKGWTASASAYWGDSEFYKKVGKTLFVKLFINSGTKQDRLEGYALVSSDSIDTPVDGLVEESIDFTGTGELEFKVDGWEEDEIGEE